MSHELFSAYVLPKEEKLFHLTRKIFPSLSYEATEPCEETIKQKMNTWSRKYGFASSSFEREHLLNDLDIDAAVAERRATSNVAIYTFLIPH